MACVVYMVHNVAPLARRATEPGTIDATVFTRQLAWLRRVGVSFVRMRDLLAWLKGTHELPRRAAVLTFDDAYASVAEHAFPILERGRTPCAIFVIAGLIGRTSNLYGHRGGKPLRHLDTSELKALLGSGLVEIGSHGYTHSNLASAPSDELAIEVIEAKQLLERTLDIAVPYFAYPGGAASDEVVSYVKGAGYACAFGTQKGKLRRRTADLWHLPRVAWGRRSSLFKLCKHFLLP